MAGRGRPKRATCTATTTKKQRGRRQAAPAKKAPAATSGAKTPDTIMDLLLDLSSRMSATEEVLATHRSKETESNYPPVRSVRDDTDVVQPDWQPINMAECTEGQSPELAQETRRQVARRLKRAPNMHMFYSDEDSDSEEEQAAPKKRRTAIKSGKVRTADTTVLKQILWPHELVYDPSGKPAAYDELPLPLFIQGYLTILVQVSMVAVLPPVGR